MWNRQEGDDWVYEIKYDGYRTQAHLKPEGITLYTRRGYDWSRTFASVAEALKAFPAREAILDGEVTVLDAQGRSDFRLLQGELASRAVNRLSYLVFDLLYLDGYDLRSSPLSERRRRLQQLMQTLEESRLQFSEAIAGGGSKIFENACQLGLEGILCKQRDAPYRSGRQDTWVKVKCSLREAFPIVAFVEKLGAKPRRIASLYVGRWERDRLLYAGKVQSGFTHKAQHDLREQLDPLIRKTSPLSSPIKKPKATWVEPQLEAEVSYSALTSDHLLRAAVFKGTRLIADTDRKLDLPPAQQLPRRRSAGSVPPKNILQLLPDAVVPTPEERRRSKG